MEVKDANGNSISYISHIQKLFEEYEHLQLEYSRLRQELNDHVVLPKNDSHYSNENNNNRTVDDLRNELECEKAQSKSLKNEVVYLLDQFRTSQKRYNDLMSIIKNDRERSAESDLSCDKKNELSLKISQLEGENKDLKENIEFITSENAVLADSMKDIEETFYKEKLQWLEEKKSHEEVLKYSRNLYDITKEQKNKIEGLEKLRDMFEKFLQFLQNSITTSGNLKDSKVLASELNDPQNGDLQAKVKLLEKAIQSGILTTTTNDATDDSSSLKAKIAKLKEEIAALATSNSCLISQNEELKKLVETENVDTELVKLKLEVANLTSKLTEQEEMNEKLVKKYARNRKVWEDNEKNFADEIRKLDDFIALIVDTLKNLPEQLKNCSELQGIITKIDQSELEKIANK